MAKYEHLPIYLATYNLTLYMYGVVNGFSRLHRYGLGSELTALCRAAARKVVRANALREKAATLLELRADLEELKLLLRLGKDLKAFQNFNSFETAINLVIDICRQNEGWMRSLGEQETSGPEPPPDSSGYGGGRAETDHRAASSPTRDVHSGRGTRKGSPAGAP